MQGLLLTAIINWTKFSSFSSSVWWYSSARIDCDGATKTMGRPCSLPRWWWLPNPWRNKRPCHSSSCPASAGWCSRFFLVRQGPRSTAGIKLDKGDALLNINNNHKRKFTQHFLKKTPSSSALRILWTSGDRATSNYIRKWWHTVKWNYFIG